MRVSVEPGVARRLLRHELERMVAKAGVTHAEMGARLGVSRASFSQVVAGKNLPSKPALEVIAAHLDAIERLPWLLDLLAIARLARGVERGGVCDRELALGLEAIAAGVVVFDPIAVTPLLQTRQYARELVDDAHAEEVGRRQGTITADEPAELEYLADEHALRRPVGGPMTMVGQYDHLLAVSERPNVTIRVIPAGQLPPPAGAFQLIRTEDEVVACQETRRSAYYYSEPEAVADYQSLLDRLRERALDPDRSRDLIARLRW